jgi:hypothetical protein
MKKILLILSIITLVSCADETKRLNNLQKMFPERKIEPATGLIKSGGYDFITIDSTGQIIAVRFYPFSETKVSSFRNVR